MTHVADRDFPMALEECWQAELAGEKEWSGKRAVCLGEGNF
jgi:hypothetical protein